MQSPAERTKGEGATTSWWSSAFLAFRRHPLTATTVGKTDRATSEVVRALDCVPHGFCIYDADDRLVFANEGFCAIYSQSMADLPFGIPFRDVLKDSTGKGNYPGRTAEEVWRERKVFIDKRERSTFLQSLGDGRLISISHQPLADGGWAAVYEDITERREAETRLRFMAHHDSLTLLPNRVLFREALDQALSTGQACAVLCLDLDGFKPVNDRLGHAAGDELLRILAERLRRHIREGDLAARLGGDEFAVLLPNVGRPEAEDAVSRLKRVISEPYVLSADPRASVGVSIGIACAPADGITSNELLAAGDAALYEAKNRPLRSVAECFHLVASRQA